MYKLSICTDELLQGHDFHIVPLKHPKDSQSAQFAFSQDYSTLAEILHHKPEFGSWFVGSEVSSDGSLLYITKCDPVFLIIPYLLQQHQTNPERYSPLEQLLEDECYPHTRKLCRCANVGSLDSVADVKGADDYKAYRYNEQKLLAWLQKKVEKLASHLENINAHVQAGAQSADFVRTNKHDDTIKADCKQYSFGIVSDYLPEPLPLLLREHLGIPKEVVHSAQEPAGKKAKAGTGGGPLEDYSKGVLSEKQQLSDKKLSANQKKLAKIDKTGMKSLTSFFAPKPKAT